MNLRPIDFLIFEKKAVSKSKEMYKVNKKDFRASESARVTP